MQTTNYTTVSPDNNKPNSTPNSNFAKRPKRKYFAIRKGTRTSQSNKHHKKQTQHTISLSKKLDYSEVNVDDVHISEQNDTLFEGDTMLRIVVAYFYRSVLMAPDESLWEGVGGSISVIQSVFNLCNTRKRFIRNTMNVINKCAENNITYDGKRIFHKQAGAPIILKSGSVEESMIADYLEGGFGYRFTTLMVNTQRVDEGLRVVGRSAVMNAAKRMIPVVTKIEKQSQGNKNHTA